MFRSNPPYNQFPQLWAPSAAIALNPHLYVVLVPGDLKELNWIKYLYLLEQRIQWMIDASIQEFGGPETDSWLTQTIFKINAAQSHPVQNRPMEEWKRDWADTLVHYTDAIQQAGEINSDQFPTPVIPPSDPRYKDLKYIHDNVMLEEWLLTYLNPYP